MKTRNRYTVRKQTSGYSSSVRYYVYDLQTKSRVSVHADILRGSAQASADRLNISEMVKDYAEDPRPYEVRLAEATMAYYSPNGSMS